MPSCLKVCEYFFTVQNKAIKKTIMNDIYNDSMKDTSDQKKKTPFLYSGVYVILSQIILTIIFVANRLIVLLVQKKSVILFWEKQQKKQSKSIEKLHF